MAPPAPWHLLPLTGANVPRKLRFDPTRLRGQDHAKQNRVFRSITRSSRGGRQHGGECAYRLQVAGPLPHRRRACTTVVASPQGAALIGCPPSASPPSRPCAAARVPDGAADRRPARAFGLDRGSAWSCAMSARARAIYCISTSRNAAGSTGSAIASTATATRASATSAGSTRTSALTTSRAWPTPRFCPTGGGAAPSAFGSAPMPSSPGPRDLQPPSPPLRPQPPDPLQQARP